MKKILQLAFGFLCASHGFSQVAVKANFVAYGATSCDNTVAVSYMNAPYPSTMWHTKDSSNLAVNQGEISGFCAPNTNENGLFDKICLVYFDDTVAYSTLVYDHFNYHITSYTPPEPYGSITFEFDSVQTGQILAFRDSINLNMVPVTPVITDNRIFEFTGLHWGRLEFNIINSTTDISQNYYMRINIGENGIYPNDSLEVATVSSYIATDCNGAITLEPLNATGDVAYAWDIPNVGSTSMVDSLCPGIYSVMMYDQDNKSAIRHFLIVDAAESFYDESTFNQIPQDTLNLVFESCNFDYTLPVDSINYTEVILSESADISVLLFNAYIYQNGNEVIFSDTVTILTNHIVMVNCGIYCATLKSTFKNKNFAFVRGGADLAELDTISENTVRIFPNPGTNLITIDGIEPQGYIADASGRIMQSINAAKVDVSQFKSGVYFIHLQGTNTVWKLVKQ